MSTITVKDILGFSNTSTETFLERIHGQAFIAVHNDVVIKGLISSDVPQRKFYLCSDEDSLDGSTTKDRFGFNYSWVINPENKLLEAGNELQSITIMNEMPEEFKDRLKFKTVKLNDSYTAEIREGFIRVGCQEISNSAVRELYSKLID